VQDMIDAAPKLEAFDSYKLWSNQAIAFEASNALRSLRVHRMDTLGYLELWAPNLQSLNLQACYGLDHLKLHKKPPHDSLKLPNDFQAPAKVMVDVTNANLSGQVYDELESIVGVEI